MSCMAMEYQKGHTQNNLNLDFRIVLFGSGFNLKTYSTMYSSYHTRKMALQTSIVHPKT
jgi:hypothetical protein